MEILRLALAQTNTIVGDLPGNSRKILDYIKQANKKEADIVVFPELALCGYPPEDLLYKEHFIKDNSKALTALAKRIKGITAVVGFVEQDKEKKLYNAAAVIADGRIQGIYRKESLPNYGVFDEKRYFTEGKSNPIFQCGKVIFGVSICEDIWEDAGACLRQKRQGADILINISSSPYHMGKLTQRHKLLISRAKEYKSFVCYNNLVGGQDELVFDGGSLILDAQGQSLGEGHHFEEDLLVKDISVPARKKKSLKGAKVVLLPGPKVKKTQVAKHRARTYNTLQRVYHALVLGTRDYVQKNGFHKVVIGLSGGIDSALVAAIARDAIGKKNVIAVTMPSKYSSEETRSDAMHLAHNLGIKLYEVPIQEVFESYTNVLKKDFAGTKTDVTEENLQARIRGNILMAFSNKFGWLVLTTGNKSEVAVGYCTLYGDMSGGFAVIKDVPKLLVYDIARTINSEKEIIPETIITRAPSAELRENQKDQDSLPSYDQLDPLIKAYVEEHQSPAQIKRKFKDQEAVKKVIRLIDYSEYKRRQSPPGVKITPRAFGKDWRVPITNRYKEF